MIRHRRVRGGDGELHGPEVLDQYEQAQLAGWVPPDRVRVERDPALVDDVVRLQEAARR